MSVRFQNPKKRSVCAEELHASDPTLDGGSGLRARQAPLEGDNKGEGGESATKSPHASSASVSDHSETGSWSKEGAIEDWDSDEEKVEDE